MSSQALKCHALVSISEFLGPGDRSINFNYDDDAQSHEDTSKEEPVEWPNDLFSPYDEATTYQLLQDLKQSKVFVCRVLVKVQFVPDV